MAGQLSSFAGRMYAKIREKRAGVISCITPALGLILIFFHPVLFQEKVFFFRDIHRWFYPMKAFLAASLKSWEIPFWCPHYFCGSPFMSDIQSGVFYPLSLLFLWLPFPISFNVFVVSHFFLGFCFFFLFIRGMGLSRKAALITSVSYAFGGYTIAVLNTLNNVSTAVWLPALLWAHQRGMNGSRSGYFLSVLFLAMAILGGEPQLVILTAALLFFHAVCLGRSRASSQGTRQDKPWKGPLLRGASVTAMVGAAILLTLVQLGPTYMDYEHSARQGGLAYEEASRFSLSPAMLKHFFLPLHFPSDFLTATATLRDFFPGTGDMPWLLTVYPGIIILPLALIALFFCPWRKTAFWAVVFALTVLLALGSHLPFHRLFYECFPFFRFPEKFVFLSSFSLLVLAAHGVDRIVHAVGSVRKGRVLFLILLGILMCDLYFNHKEVNPVCDADFFAYHHPALTPIIEDQDIFRIYEDSMPNPPGLSNTIRNHHLKWQMMIHPNLGILFALDHVGGVPALELRYQHQITELLSRPWREKIRFLRLANVRYIITMEPLDRKAGLEGQVERVNGLVFRIKDALPRAWLVNRIEATDTQTVNDLLSAGFDPSESALGNKKISGKYGADERMSPVHVTYTPNAIVARTKTDGPAILVISESSYPGWTVSVNGEPRELLWLNLLYQGVALEAGSHEVVFRYRPEHFHWFAGISLLGGVVFLGVWGLSVWAKRPRRGDCHPRA